MLRLSLRPNVVAAYLSALMVCVMGWLVYQRVDGARSVSVGSRSALTVMTAVRALDASMRDANLAERDLVVGAVDGRDLRVRRDLAAQLVAGARRPVALPHPRGPHAGGLQRPLPGGDADCGRLGVRRAGDVVDGAVAQPQQVVDGVERALDLVRDDGGVVADEPGVGHHDGQPGRERGAWSDLLLDGQVTGRVLRTRDGVKPVFVSVGHRVDLETACRHVLALSPRHRLPETTRAADRLSRAALKTAMAATP